ncbi:hypothetical protein [Streptacidiphilus cavernicola]|uniref:PH domain-containing protein n=1 Tax=Streptacidiphilus cavernicola TaxID=3342716 RepID=A0ABV6VQL9_9ACTN
MEALWLEREPMARHGAAITVLLLVGGIPVLLTAGAPLALAARIVVVSGAVLLGLVLAVRTERAAVHCQPEEIVIRGLVRNRRVRIRDVIGVRGNHVYWGSSRGALRRSRLTGVADLPSRFPGVGASSHRNPELLEAWIEQAVGSRLKGRARNVPRLDDAALSRELQLAGAGVRWEAHRRRLSPEPPKLRWLGVRDAAAAEAAKRHLDTHRKQN